MSTKEVWDATSLGKMEDWAEQTDIPLEKLQEKFLEEYTVLLKRYPKKPKKFYQERSRFAIKSTIVDPILRSPSKPVMNFIIGFSSVRDIWYNRKRTAIATYKENPEGAVSSGLVHVEMGDDGEPIITPLDVNETFKKDGRKNPNFRKPLPYTPQRTVLSLGYPLFEKHQKRVEGLGQSLLKFISIKVGKYSKNKDGTIKVNNPEDWTPPLHTTCQMHLNVRRPLTKSLDNPIMYLYNDASDLRVKPVDGATFSDKIEFDQETIWKIFTEAPEEFYAEMDEIGEWIENNSDSWDMFIIIDGWVSNIQHELDEGQNNHYMELQDMAENSVGVWVHPGIYPLIEEVGRKTHVSIVGWPRKTTDETTGQSRTSISAWSIAIDPEEFYPRSEDVQEEVKEEE